MDSEIPAPPEGGVPPQTTTLYRNATLLLPGHRFAQGGVLVRGDRIAAVAEGASPEPADGAVVDCTGLLLMPGLVNAHGHTAMTLVRGVGGGLPLQRWLNEAIFPIEAKMTPADIAAGMTWGALEMLAGGTTCVADMYDFPETGAAALAATGMRGHLCRVGLSFAPNRLAECAAFVRTGVPASARGLVAADLCIHSEYLTDEPFCRELAALNRELKRPVHLHLSETEAEHRECLARHGRTPAAYLADTGLLDHGGYAAHCVWCTDDDFRILRDHGVSVVHNPTSNLKLGSGVARIPDARALGVNVALGTDGCASNDNLDLFEEMHLAALLPKGVRRDPTLLPSWDVIDMATVGGAKALGRDDLGEIAVGRKADFCLVRLDRPHLAPAADLADLIVHSMHASDVVKTVVDGVVRYDGGAWPGVDAAAAKTALLEACARIGVRTV